MLIIILRRPKCTMLQELMLFGFRCISTSSWIGCKSIAGLPPAKTQRHPYIPLGAVEGGTESSVSFTGEHYAETCYPEPRPLDLDYTSVLTTRPLALNPRGKWQRTQTTKPPWALSIRPKFPNRRQIVRKFPGKVRPRSRNLPFW